MIQALYISLELRQSIAARNNIFLFLHLDRPFKNTEYLVKIIKQRAEEHYRDSTENFRFPLKMCGVRKILVGYIEVGPSFGVQNEAKLPCVRSLLMRSQCEVEQARKSHDCPTVSNLVISTTVSSHLKSLQSARNCRRCDDTNAFQPSPA
jgi:hypothetical protein